MGVDTSIIKDFETRKAYKEDFLNQFTETQRASFVDFWYSRPNYGLVNEDFEPVVLLVDDERSNLKRFGTYSEQAEGCSFAVDMYNKFRQSYLEVLSNSDLMVPKYLSENLEVVKGYENFDQSDGVYTLYRGYLEAFYISELREINFSNYQEFEAEFLRLVNKNLEQFPITRSGFLLSKHCPLSVSGIAIELATLEYDDDLMKQEIVKTEDFHCFLEQCTNHGFMVDKNAPWRLVVNFESPSFRDQISLTQQNTSYLNILNHFYRTKTHYDDIFEVKEFAAAVYNTIVREDPINIDGRSFRTTNPENLEDENHWIGLYWHIRSRELGIPEEEAARNLNEFLTYHYIYRNAFSGNTFRAVSGKIGKVCANFIAKTYKNHYNIDTNKPLHLKEYYK